MPDILCRDDERKGRSRDWKQWPRVETDGMDAISTPLLCPGCCRGRVMFLDSHMEAS